LGGDAEDVEVGGAEDAVGGVDFDEADELGDAVKTPAPFYVLPNRG
jgi:hypothetical protein